MHGRIWIAGVLGLGLTLGAATGPAWADDKSDCLKGIKKLQAIKKPTEKQKMMLASAEQEQTEADWSHCKQILTTK